MRDRLPIILSTTALLVAVLGATPLGEAAYNAVVPPKSVGTKQLRNNSVTAAKLHNGSVTAAKLHRLSVTNAKLRGDAVTSGKVKNRSLKAIDFKQGQLPAGPPGPKGDKGDKGVNGAQGAPGLAGLQIVSATSPLDSMNKGVSVTCPAGKKVLGGGGNVPARPQLSLSQSVPLGDSGWRIYAQENAPFAPKWSITVYAVCANVAA